jgi:hypothetical protein
VAATKPKAKPKSHPFQDKLKAGDKAALAKAFASPGLRKYIPDQYLAQNPAGKKVLQQRALTARLNAPITPGSTTTERALAHEAQAAQTVKYQPAETALNQQIGVSQQTQRDTGSFYDQYQQNLQAHQANIAAFQQGAQQALQQTAAGITGLSGAQGAELQQAANQRAQQQGVTQAGDLSQLANQATAVRQGLMGSFQNQQTLQSQAANTYADTQANVVAPGQKLTALAQAGGRTRDLQQKQADLRTEEGAYNQQYRSERRTDEAKNVLAQSIASNKTVAELAKIKADAVKNDPATIVATTSAKTTATEEAKNAAKLGLSVHDYRLLGPTVRAQRLKDLKATKPGSASDTRYSSGPFAGMLKSSVNALTPDAAQKLVDKYNKKKGTKTPGAAPDWKPSNDQSKGRSQVVSLRDYANKAKAGQPFVAGHAGQPRMTRQQAAAKIKASVAAPADPILLTAALDAAYNGRLSRTTVRALIQAGYKPGQIASALGVGTGPGSAYAGPSGSSAGGGAARPGGA